MSAQPNLLPLKALVISLGFILIGGTLFLIAAIAGKGAKEIAAHHCESVVTAELHLPEKKDIRSISPQGDTIQITITAADKTQVLTLERCTGKLLQTFIIKP